MLKCLLTSFYLKLERTYLNYRALATTNDVAPPPFFFQMTILSMHLLPRMNFMLDFICIGSVDLRGARGKRKQNTKWKILAHSGTRTQNLELRRQILTPTGLAELDESFHSKVLYMEVWLWRVQDQIEYLVVFCTLKVKTGLLRLFAICPI